MKKVREFHEKMELAVDQPFSKELLEFRMKLIFEEVHELAEAGIELDSNLDLEERHVLMQDFLKSKQSKHWRKNSHIRTVISKISETP